MKERGNVLVIGGGGRESVLVDKYAQSTNVEKVVAVPGNDTMTVWSRKPVKTYQELTTTNIPEIIEICRKENISLVDVAQDNAVEAGLVDDIDGLGIAVVGPTKDAGQIEWNKAWSREFGERQELPQPFFKICRSPQEGADFINSHPDRKWFIKAAGLAEGKGAFPARSKKEALEGIREMARFKDRGEVFLIEEWLEGDDGSPGEEFSTFVISDGQNYQIVGSAQDHKLVFDGDKGDQTGGMGCSTPPLVLTSDLMEKTDQRILKKTIAGLAEEGRRYKGVLYLGGMKVMRQNENAPYVVEFNARWGDPEAQVILPGITTDFYDIGMAIANGDISNLQIETDGKARVVVAGVSKGYPGDYSRIRGKQIFGLGDARKVDGVKVYGAGVRITDEKYYVNGGRLFYVVGEGKNVINAREKAYEAMSMVHIDGNNLHFRTDIGWRDVQRLRGNA